MNKLLTLQQKAAEYLIADPSLLQILLQLQLNALRLNQTALRAANTCGCLGLGTAKLPSAEEADWQTLADKQPTGDDISALCPKCRHELQEQLGALLFYAAALANALNFSLDELVDAEISKLDLLGYFMLL